MSCTLDYLPDLDLQIGSTFSFRTHPFFGARVHEFRVVDVSDDSIRFSRNGWSMSWMPIVSVPHFIHDLQGKVVGPPCSNEIIDTVLSGNAEFLGKGDDGMAFRVGDQVVKVSTTVPYVPENPGHRTPGEAAMMIVQQVEAASTLIGLGVRGIQDSNVLIHFEKAFQIKPYVHVPERFSQAQLDATQDILRSMHKVGWALNDSVEAGLMGDEPFLFDIGKAAPIPIPDKSMVPVFRDQESSFDIEMLRLFYRQHGGIYEPQGGSAFEVWRSVLNLGPRASPYPYPNFTRSKLDGARDAYAAELKRTTDDGALLEVLLEDLQHEYGNAITAIAALEKGKAA